MTTRWMMPALLALGTLLLAALVAIALLLANLPAATPAAADPEPTPEAIETPEPTPTATPEAAETPEPAAEPAPPAPAPAPPAPAPAPPAPPANPKPVFTTFSPKNGTDVNCADEYDSRDVYFNWTTHNADQAWIGISTQNAQQAPYAAVPVSGSYKITFQCANESEIYTVTAVGSYGTAHYTVRLYR